MKKSAGPDAALLHQRAQWCLFYSFSNVCWPMVVKCAVMKIFEKSLYGKLDRLQFVYQDGKGVVNAKHFILKCVCTWRKSQVGILFTAFFLPSKRYNLNLILIDRPESHFEQPEQFLMLLLNVTIRIQKVLVDDGISSTRLSNIGWPQGCIPSPLLFIFCRQLEGRTGGQLCCEVLRRYCPSDSSSGPRFRPWSSLIHFCKMVWW